LARLDAGIVGSNPTCSPLKANDVSEEHVASIVRIEELARQEASMKKAQKVSTVFYVA
jgi:hypothetical protein